MNTIIELTKQVTQREAEMESVIGKTKQKAYDIVYEEATLQGIVRNNKFVKGTCPKDALKNFRREMDCVECFTVIEIQSPTNKRGWLSYKVYNNKSILR